MVDRHMVLAAKGGGMVFAGRLFVWGSRFGMAVLLARLLGADQYGLYNITLPAATNYNSCFSCAEASIGGMPRILVEKDLAILPAGYDAQ